MVRVVCPACAGMIRIRQRWQNRQISLPRMRGDDPVLGQLKAGVKEFAPHARG